MTARTDPARQPPSLQNSGTDLSLELQLAATGQIQAVPPESHPSNTKFDHRTQQVMARTHPTRQFPWLLNSGTKQFRTAVCHNKPDPGHGTNVIVVALCNFDSSTHIISSSFSFYILSNMRIAMYDLLLINIYIYNFKSVDGTSNIPFNKW